MRTILGAAGVLAAATMLLATTASAARLPAPILDGFQVAWHFPGARTDQTPSPVATVVHCTNLGSRRGSVLVEAFNANASVVGFDVEDFDPGQTRTIAVGDVTAFYVEHGLVTFLGDLAQGLVRVSVKGERRTVCHAQVLDAVGTTPSFIVDLPVFDKNGKF